MLLIHRRRSPRCLSTMFDFAVFAAVAVINLLNFSPIRSSTIGQVKEFNYDGDAIDYYYILYFIHSELRNVVGGDGGDVDLRTHFL